MDLDAYPSWNPFTPRVTSTLKEGHPVRLVVAMFGQNKRPLIETLRVLAHVPGKKLDWGKVMGAPWLLRTHRTQQVEAAGPGRCRYHTTDAFFGLLAPLVMAIFGRRIQRGFDGIAAGLKAQSEASTKMDKKNPVVSTGF